MEGFNKLISFILGLVVVVVFLAILTGKINLSGLGFRGIKPFTETKTTPTPTPSPLLSLKQSPTPYVVNQYQTQTKINSQQTTKQIPATGSPTLLLPILVSSLASGFYLKKKK